MGDPNTPEGLEQMKRQSPLTYADRIKTPLMVVQGANDPRVNKRESDQIVIALRDRGYAVEYILAPDEGHGFARPVNNMAMLAAAEKFLAKHLGGRYQDSMTKEVQKRLGEITVDPKDVKIEKAADASAAPSVEVTGKWSVSLEAGGQAVDLDLELEQNGAEIGGKMISALGGGTLEKGRVSGANISGTINADVQGQPMEIKMEGKVEGSKMTGTFMVPGIGNLPFTAVKNK